MAEFNVIPSSHYYREDIFQAEYENIFSGSWVFAGMLHELENDKDYITFDIFGRSVVIQNFNGRLKCFHNICSHRFNKIQDTTFGNRPLLCKYHFWGYDENGFPRTIPRKESFSLTPDELECLKLRQYEVATCGQFVFIKMDAGNTTSLEAYLGEYKQHLLDISQYLGDRFYWTDAEHKGNWKLLIENVLECYHCSSVHASSFFQMGYGQRSPENINFYGSHSVCDFPKTETKTNAKKSKVLAYLEERPLKHESYRHYFIFPNLVFSSTEGVSFYIGQLLPQAADTTVLRVRTFDTILDPEKKKSPVHDAFKDGASAVTLTVISEDKAIIENVQQGIMQTRRNPLFGKEEVRISAFHEQYLELMKENIVVSQSVN